MKQYLLLTAALCGGLLWTTDGHAQHYCPRVVGPSSTVVYVYLPTAEPVPCCTITDPTDQRQYDACLGPGAGDFRFPTILDGLVSTALKTCVAGGIPALTPFIANPAGATIDDLAARLETAIDFELCELDVDVHVSTTAPDITVAPLAGADKWTIVVVGQDNLNGTIGYAQPTERFVDSQRNHDWARIWLDAVSNWAGADLTGANNDLERWTTTLANFITHEIGHGFNARHLFSCPMVPNPTTGEEDLSYCLSLTLVEAASVSGCTCWKKLAKERCEEPSFWPPGEQLEDPAQGHLLAQPVKFEAAQPPTESTGCLIPTMHAEKLQHLSDVNIGVTGGIVGLSIQTLSSWNFLNPNNQAANRMAMTFIRKHTSDPVQPLSITGFYTGKYGPWINDTSMIPRVTGAVPDPPRPVTPPGVPPATIGGPPPDPCGASTRMTGQLCINDELYDIYQLVLSEANSEWKTVPDDDGDVVVPAGAEFHTGITFAEAGVMLFGVRLQRKNASNPSQFDDMLLQPRYVEFEATDLPSESYCGGGEFEAGIWGFNAFNWDREFTDRDLIIKDFQVHLLPRRIALDAMLVDADLVSIHGGPVQPLRRLSRAQLPTFPLSVGAKSQKIAITSLADDRYLDTLDALCSTQQPELCPIAGQLGLFPATYVYISGTVLDEHVKHWDVGQGQFVTGPVRTRFFRQVAGFRPDLNANGVDDRIDIALRGSADRNDDGVPDDAPGNLPPGR